MKIYNKLVRDNIPAIIKEQNKTSKTRILSDEEYLVELNKKLKEELNEYLESENVEELADLQEVILAVLEAKNCTYDEFEEIRKSKVTKRGAFKNKIFLESVD